METEEKKDIKFLMDTDWLIQEPIDFEHKKYVLLGYFKKIDDLLNQNKIYPTFIELSLHLASLQTLLKENVILYTDKVFKSPDDEVLFKDLSVKHLPNLNKEETKEIDTILKYSSTKFFEYFNIVKSYWSVIYDTISITLKRNKRYLKNGVGYMTYTDKKNNKVYVWQYSLYEFTKNVNEHYIELSLIYEGDKKKFTFNQIIELYSNYLDKDKKNSPVFDMKASEEYPLNETLVPLFKRKLMSYVLQSVRLETIKKLED